MTVSGDADVLLVCGSYHTRSTNRVVLDFVSRRLSSKTSLRITEADAPDRLPALDAAQIETPPDAVRAFRAQVDGARGFVVAGPEYAGGLAGSLKNTLDWCVGADSGFYRKVVVVLSAGTSGGSNALRQQAQTLLWQGAYVVGQLGIAGPRSKIDHDGVLVDQPTQAALNALADTLGGALDDPPSARAAETLRVARQLGIQHFPHRARLLDEARESG